jgi:phosphoribosylaminoimidazolecarboxamide formyltransferase/IMP cyclohydrolase
MLSCDNNHLSIESDRKMSVKSRNTPVPNLVPVKRALLSVSDKLGLVKFATQLVEHGVELVSTGGTYKELFDAGLAVRDISDLTGFPEIMDGRVKTLHPNVHGGILAIRDEEDHKQAMRDHNIEPIDMVISNLYPFEKTVAANADYADSIENVDIGGPTLIRASAKNHAYVAIVTDPNDYQNIADALAKNKGALPYALRQSLAQKAFARTAAYDAAISNWFANALDIANPPYRTIGGKLAEVMRYGENPHQKAAFYKTGETRKGVATATQLQGKKLSYNNINDTDAAFEMASEFDPDKVAAVVIVKHANPCGVAIGKTLKEAYLKALACDPVSAFGGIVAMNRPLDAATSTEIVKIMTEVIIAPEVEAEANAMIASRKNLRLLITGGMPDPRETGTTVKTVSGGLLVQNRDNAVIDDMELKTVTKRVPTEKELADLKMAFKVAKYVKSNAIIYVRDGATVGVGAGQMSRVDSSRIAARKSVDAAELAGEDAPLTVGSVVASDAFFPFADGLISAIEAGATAAIQPGGSMRDDEVIAAADEAGIAMVFTGHRHFRH